jgi:hypothetical protein
VFCGHDFGEMGHGFDTQRRDYLRQIGRSVETSW